MRGQVPYIALVEGVDLDQPPTDHLDATAAAFDALPVRTRDIRVDRGAGAQHPHDVATVLVELPIEPGQRTRQRTRTLGRQELLPQLRALASLGGGVGKRGLPALVAVVRIGASVMWLARRGGVPGALLLWAGIGTVLAICEMIVHIFVDSDAAAFAQGRGAPLVDLHLLLQAVYTPVLGTAFATLAIWGARGRRLSHPTIAALGP